MTPYWCDIDDDNKDKSVHAWRFATITTKHSCFVQMNFCVKPPPFLLAKHEWNGQKSRLYFLKKFICFKIRLLLSCRSRSGQIRLFSQKTRNWSKKRNLLVIDKESIINQWCVNKTKKTMISTPKLLGRCDRLKRSAWRLFLQSYRSRIASIVSIDPIKSKKTNCYNSVIHCRSIRVLSQNCPENVRKISELRRTSHQSTGKDYLDSIESKLASLHNKMNICFTFMH